MAEQTFKSPNFYETETDLSTPAPGSPTGVPGGVIGTANRGPAFVPVTVANTEEFNQKFGGIDPDRVATYAADEFLKNKTALTYMRVLGAGANGVDPTTATKYITATQNFGVVKNAGFFLSASFDNDVGRHKGAVQFITAEHTAQADELNFPTFSNDSITNTLSMPFVRGVVFLASGASLRVNSVPTFSTAADQSVSDASGLFVMFISSSLNTYGQAGVKVLSASLDPDNASYIGKVLNTDPKRFEEEQHLLYADYAVDDQLATTKGKIVAIVSGSGNTAVNMSDTGDQLGIRHFREAYGSFDTRYHAPQTTWFISQPFGNVEYDLFKFEALDDGEYANSLYKISITNIQRSLDDSDPYGTFTVQVRDFNDDDLNLRILEQFTNVSLNPTAKNYIGKLIGDKKTAFNFDVTDSNERRLVTTGKYENVSMYVRVVMSDDVEYGNVPSNALPFGFRGPVVLKTTNTDVASPDTAASKRIGFTPATLAGEALSGSIVPPIPYRVKVTRGTMSGSPDSPIVASQFETAAATLYWGVKFERNTSPLNANVGSDKNTFIKSLTKMAGIEKLNVVATGSSADALNNNKFSLSKVILSGSTTSYLDTVGSIPNVMKEAVYVRNGVLQTGNGYKINYDGGDRITLATLLTQLSASQFNLYSPFMKFSTFMAGGFDGINYLDPKARLFNDRATSMDVLGGGAASTYQPVGWPSGLTPGQKSNNAVASYTQAVDIMTEPMNVNINVLAVPGIKDDYITDYASDAIKNYGFGLYVMDLPSYDDDSNLLFSDQTTLPNVYKTADTFDSRVIDNNYVATYFPDVFITDAVRTRNVKVPASVAAMGALGFNDKIAYPWFAPAGFNRAALDFVNNVSVRLNSSDRDRLYVSRINPIATFPRLGYVIYGQKTLQVAKSALDRVNVRRLVLEVKRSIVDIAKNIVFEQNTPTVRNRFVAEANTRLAFIQFQSGIEQFQVVCNETNNTPADIDMNKLNGRIVIVPTRVIEFIAINFIITNSGVQFV